MRRKHLLILFLLAIPLLGYNQSPCKTEFCRIIQAKITEIENLKKLLRDKNTEIRTLKTTIARQERIIQSQQQTISVLKRVIANQRKTIDSLMVITGVDPNKRKREENKLKIFEDSIARVDVANMGLRKQMEQDQIQIKALTKENEDLNRMLNGIKINNFIFDSTYIVPYGLSIGPIPYNNDFILDPPDPDSYKFLEQLKKTPNDVDVVIEISAEGRKREEKKLKEALSDQMKDFCPSCKFTFRFTPANRDLIYLKLYHQKYSPPPPKP